MSPDEFIPKWPFTPTRTKPVATLTPSATSGNVTLTASTGVFTSAHVHQYIEGNLGIARITAITSPTVVKAFVLTPFFDTSAIASQAWTILGGYEDVWSDARGWPLSCTFYQNRLVFGGAKSLPHAIALSAIGLYFDFDPGQALDDDAIFTVLQAKDEVPAIYHLMADLHLQLFTSAGEYYVPVSEDTPLTPRNFAARRTTGRGIRQECRPVNLDGNTLFCQAGGKAFREFIYAGGEGPNAYQSPSLSFHWSHLVATPVDVTIRPSREQDDADLLISVETDGTIAAAIRMRDQGLNGASKWTTDGLYRGACSVDDDTYLVVDRTIGGVTRRYLEFVDESTELFVDCGVTTTTPGTTITGLSHLEGETVVARADGFWHTGLVVSGGQITLPDAIVAEAQAGLDYTPLAETLPPWKAGQGGPVILDGMTHIARVDVSVVATQNLLVQGDFVDFRNFDDDIDDPVPEFTGTKIVDGLLGWQRDNKVVLTQDGPAPLSLRGIEYLVET